VALLVFGFASLRSQPSRVPEALLIATIPGEPEAFRLDLFSSDFAGAHPIELARLPRVPRPTATSSRAQLSPDGRYWAIDTVFADSGGQDVALIDARTGALRRLTRGRGDDNLPSWSPDGAQLVYSSGGLHPKNRNKLMAIEVASGRARPITVGDASDVMPAWHPSGTHIAFSRRHWIDRPDDLCLVSTGGQLLDCIALPGQHSTGIVGWQDAQRVVVRGTLDNGAAGQLTLVNVATREVTRLGDMLAESATISGDGQWLACRCRPSGAATQPYRSYVFPTRRPDLARPVRYDLTDERNVGLLWTAPRSSPQMVVGVAIDAPRLIHVNAPAELRAAGVEVSGQRTSALPMRWESLDPAIAIVDSFSGVLTPHRAGMARVRVDVGGWRSAEASVEVVAPDARTLLRESWTGGLETHFVPAGDPRPIRVQLPGIGPALAINGDSSYTSGIHSRELVDAQRGIGADLVMSARISEPQWQNLSVNLMAFDDDSAFARWDRIHGGIPITAARSAPECYFTMPLGEGPRALRGYSVSNPDTTSIQPLPQRLRSGQPFRMRIQLFPDGACGFAIDGKRVAWLPGRRLGRERYRLLIHGYSVGTTIATGPIEMWSGVKPDIDWRQGLNSSEVSARPSIRRR
jgi:hypothetical protein